MYQSGLTEVMHLVSALSICVHRQFQPTILFLRTALIIAHIHFYAITERDNRKFSLILWMFPVQISVQRLSILTEEYGFPQVLRTTSEEIS